MVEDRPRRRGKKKKKRGAGGASRSSGNEGSLYSSGAISKSSHDSRGLPGRRGQRSLRSGGEDDGGIYHESHMRGNVLNLDPIVEERRKPSY